MKYQYPQKFVFFILIFHFFFLSGWSQDGWIDSLKIELSETGNDTLSLKDNGILSYYYTEIKPDSAYYFGERELALAQKLGLRLNEAHALAQLGYLLMNLGDYPKSLKMFLSSIRIAEDPRSERILLPKKYAYAEYVYTQKEAPTFQRLAELTRAHQLVGVLYGNAGNNETAKYHYLKAKNLAEETENIQQLSLVNGTLGRSYMQLKNLDSALICLKQAYDLSVKIGFEKYQGSYLLNLARTYSLLHESNLATATFKKAMEACQKEKYLRGVVACDLALAEHYYGVGNPDSSLYYIQDAVDLSQQLNTPTLMQRSYSSLAAYYNRKNRYDSVAKYQDLIIKINDTLFNSAQSRQFQSIDFDAIKNQLEEEAAKEARQYQVRLYSLLGGLVMIFIFVVILWRNNQQRKKSYQLLKRQKQETDYQRSVAEKALDELKTTQKQLIQSEKMASLGELTAGIAHEIQNPLNFVNNFADINLELLEDLKMAIEKEDWQEAKSIMDQLNGNEIKIKTHGQRADGIVKSMLLHSRTSKTIKEPIDINKLADEYLRLAFHGMRAKDKGFNIRMEFHPDPDAGIISVVPGDIGRVLLNLFNNAFYEVNEKKKRENGAYEPAVTVETKRDQNLVIIRVSDNGPGIPESIMDKIFQPFFTTKPTGEGTGLGLSLSYDLVVKGHNGEFKVDTSDQKGTTFTIILPVEDQEGN